MSLSHFHPIIREWFQQRFDAPIGAQSAGREAIAQGNHTLIAAPTGSGKTLAAFLTCIDQLVRQGIEEGLPDATQVVYVSPLKALSNDIQKNLATPLEEIATLAAARGTPLPEIVTAVRTGDWCISSLPITLHQPLESRLEQSYTRPTHNAGLFLDEFLVTISKC